MTEAESCAWCDRTFRPRVTGGHPQRFCRPVCRRAFDAGGRRWVAEAVAGGTLTLNSLRSGATTTRGLLLEAVSPPPIDPARKLAPVAPVESPDEAADLLDDFLIALLDLPGDTWPDIAAALPDEIFDRIDRWMEVRFVR